MMGECFRKDNKVPKSAKLNDTEEEKQDLAAKDYVDQMTEPDEDNRPVLFVSPGLTSHSQIPYVKQIVKKMTAQGFDVVIINYRGLADAPLTTPRLYHANGWEDVLEPMKYIYEKYCVPHNKKAFAMGCSMGANILGNLLGH
jgi:predicted alpha/beta-fold hydrolase